MESLKWMFSLYDNMSGPADRMGKSLDDLFGSVNALPAATAIAQQGLDLLFSGAQRLASLAWDAGSFAVGALAFKEQSLKSFELMMGTKDAAKDMFKTLQGMAELSPYNTQDLINAATQLSQNGFNQQEIPVVLQAIGDATGGDPTKSWGLANVMGQIRGAGKINGGDLMQLGNNGVGRGVVFDAIAKLMKVKPSDVADLISQGKVSADVALDGVMNAIIKTFDNGGGVGTAMLENSQTLKGLFSTLNSKMFDGFLNIDLDNSPGFKGLKRFFVNLTDALSPRTDAGQKLQATIERVVNGIGSFMGTFTPQVFLDGFTKVVDIMTTAVEGVGAFKDGFMDALGPALEWMSQLDLGKDSAITFSDVMKGLGYVIGVAAAGIAGIGVAIQGLSLLWTGVDWGFAIDQFREFGRDTVRGLVEGIKSMYELPVKAIMGLGAATVEAFKLVLGIHSPSKVFEQLGAYTAEGYAVGLDGSQARVDQSITGMVRVPSKGGAAGGTPTINLTVQVDATGNDADAIARKLADLLPGQLASAFEELALEGGTA